MTQIVVLEALVAALALPGLDVSGTFGASFYAGAGAKHLLLLSVATGFIIVTELGASWLLQRRPRSSTK
jgi:hypothetical protein